jgi:hypothetical protein
VRHTVHKLAVLSTNASLCQCQIDCSASHNDSTPVCDSLGRTHSSLCEFSRSKCTLKILYVSRVVVRLSRRVCRYDIHVEMRYIGTCCDSTCTPRQHAIFPMCDTDGRRAVPSTQFHRHAGVMHINLCAFYIARCEKQRLYNTSLSMKRFGKC